MHQSIIVDGEGGRGRKVEGEGGGSGLVKREEGLRFLDVRVGQREWHGIVKRHLFNK